MTDAVLDRVKNHLTANTFAITLGYADWGDFKWGSSSDTGYAFRQMQFTDADLEGNTPFLMIKRMGGGASNPLLQQVDVMIILVDNPTGLLAASNQMDSIVQEFRDSDTETGVIRFEPLGEKRGPFFFENGRPWFQFDVRVYVEDQ